MIRGILFALALIALSLALVVPAEAVVPGGSMAEVIQGGLADPQALAGQNLRGYTHMFIAYFIAWAIIFGWVISIARRLRRLEKALRE